MDQHEANQRKEMISLLWRCFDVLNAYKDITEAGKLITDLKQFFKKNLISRS